MQRGGCVYIVTNKQHAVFYTGVTSDLISRVWDHQNKLILKVLLPGIIVVSWFIIVSIRT
ncbi:putative GIY-YIG superfamily endonuclease [Mucilaginibacter sp. UYP25]